MLRITRHDVDAHRVTLVLKGHILLEGADLLERECEELQRSGLEVVLDIFGVFFIGRTGVEALTRLSRSGVKIEGSSPLIADMLEQDGIAVSRKIREPRR